MRTKGAPRGEICPLSLSNKPLFAALRLAQWSPGAVPQWPLCHQALLLHPKAHRTHLRCHAVRRQRWQAMTQPSCYFRCSELENHRKKKNTAQLHLMAAGPRCGAPSPGQLWHMGRVWGWRWVTGGMGYGRRLGWGWRGFEEVEGAPSTLKCLLFNVFPAIAGDFDMAVCSSTA